MSAVPAVLLAYVDGLMQHDVAAIGATVGSDLAFVARDRVLDRAAFLAFLTALYQAFPDWTYDHDPPRALSSGAFVIRWRQGGKHSGTLALPGFPVVSPTGRSVRIPEQDFCYRIEAELIREIRPDPVEGGAPHGIFQQIGIALPPL